jgi:hypothetical protein
MDQWGAWEFAHVGKIACVKCQLLIEEKAEKLDAQRNGFNLETPEAFRSAASLSMFGESVHHAKVFNKQLFEFSVVLPCHCPALANQGA